MPISGKVWGTTEPVLVTPTLEMHRLWIEPNHQCSMHRHQRKWNAFVVIYGILFIDVEKSYGLTDITKLSPGNVCTVAPGEFHRFRTGPDEGCQAIEVYYTDALGEDIERRDHGGQA
jgi:mannose-6-phosphate isomerase-like protein (cupin superfamily)